MKTLTQYIKENLNKGNQYISNRYTPIENQAQYLRNFASSLSVVVKTIDNIAIEVLSSRFNDREYIEAWLYSNIAGGSPVYKKFIIEWIQENGFSCWVRTVSTSDIRIILWPEDVKQYPWPNDSEKYF